MGLFRRKTKDIVLKQDISGYLVFPFPLKKDYVMLGRKAVVPEGTVLAFATKGKVLDILPEGQHTLTPAYLPLANKKFKLNKIDKYGQSPDGFYGYAYYVNLGAVKNFAFGTYKKLRYKNELDGKFWVKMEFAVNLQVSDEKLFMKSLFRSLAFLKPNEAENIVEGWLSEFATDTLQKYAFRRAEFEKPRVYEMTELLGARIQPLLKTVGLDLLGIGLLECDLSSPQKVPKNPLFAPVENLNPVFQAEIPNRQKVVQEEIDENFEDEVFDDFEEFEEKSSSYDFQDFEDNDDLMNIESFENDFEEEFDKNLAEFDKKQEKKQLQTPNEGHINILEDIDYMKKNASPETWQSLEEPDYEAIEARRATLEEEFYKKNYAETQTPKLEKKQQLSRKKWSGWEKFLGRE